MSPRYTALAMGAALATGVAHAQTTPRSDVPPGAASPAPTTPGASQGPQNCPMMNGRVMLNGSAMGAHMQNGHMVDKDGKPIMGGMMGPKGIMCVPQASATPQAGKVPPKADK